MPKLVKLKLSSSALSQFPELPTELKKESSRKSESVKQKYAPTESSPLAQPKPVKPTSVKLETSSESSGAQEKDKKDSKTSSGFILSIPKVSDSGSSPQPDVPSRTDTPVSRPTGPTRVGLTMNATTVVELDKSGAPARKWVRNKSKIKSFSGYFIPITDWKSPEAPKTPAVTDSKKAGDENTNGKEQKVRISKSDQKTSEDSNADVKTEESVPPATPITA